MNTRPDEKNVARVDFMVDERGNPVDVPDDEGLKVATAAEETIGATGPTNWWRLGIVALGVMIATILVLQFVGGNTGTAVVPGTPVAAPQTETPS